MNIDRIARGMVDVEPSADLEARIRARLDAVRPARTMAWGTWRVGAPLAAAAALALIIGVQVSRGRDIGRGPGVQGSSSSEAVTSQLPNVPTSQLSNVPTSRLSKAAPQLTSEEIAWMDRRIPALDPVTALQMDHLRVDSIQPEPLAITPLTMTTLGADGAGIERRNDR